VWALAGLFAPTASKVWGCLPVGDCLVVGVVF